MKISIIIAVKNFNDNLKESLSHCLKLDYPDYEIIVVPDWTIGSDDKRIKVLPSGPNRLPAKKRDMAAETAEGEILAFLDDDAYPDPGWLKNAVKNFDDPKIAAVGGPAITPPHDSERARASGLVYESVLVSGNFRYRYVKGKRQFVDDYPSCNLLVRKDVFNRIGGFKTDFWPGEDTFLCLEIINLGLRIVYDPEALVYHHRRTLFLGHLRQIKSYALHRGYFVKRYPKTSLRWQYFVPSLFVLWLFLGSLPPGWWPFYLFFLLSYASIVFVNAYHKNDARLTRLVFAGIFVSHFTYGIFFLFGLMKKSLDEEDLDA